MNITKSFQVGQIVSLDCQNNHLYSEVIQTIETRNICWVRPLILTQIVDESWENSLPQTIIDMRCTSDLLYPAQLFRPAWDTEVIPLLTQLNTDDITPEKVPLARQQLQQFIWQVFKQKMDNIIFL